MTAQSVAVSCPTLPVTVYLTVPVPADTPALTVGCVVVWELGVVSPDNDIALPESACSVYVPYVTLSVRVDGELKVKLVGNVEVSVFLVLEKIVCDVGLITFLLVVINGKIS